MQKDEKSFQRGQNVKFSGHEREAGMSGSRSGYREVKRDIEDGRIHSQPESGIMTENPTKPYHDDNKHITTYSYNYGPAVCSHYRSTPREATLPANLAPALPLLCSFSRSLPSRGARACAAGGGAA